jgi:hypothetical protein
MPSYVVRNENFRDEVIKVPYPFDRFFIEELDNIYIGFDTFIDASFFFKTDVELPISISQIDGTIGDPEMIRIVFTDAENTTVGNCDISLGETIGQVLNPQGILVGLITFDMVGLDRIIAQADGQLTTAISGDLTFAIDTCKVIKTKNMQYIALGDQALTDVVKIQARHGVQWRDENGTLHLDVLGDVIEDTANSRPLLSVNGVKNPTIWLTTEPETNLRISTDKDSIEFGQAKDITS